MAGATAEILLADDSDAPLAVWRAIVTEMSASVVERDFWITPEAGDTETGYDLPFYWNESRPSDGARWTLDDPAGTVAAIRAAFGFTPRRSIELGAMCRGRPSDRILARLAASFLSRQPGVLLFDGLLAASLEPGQWPTYRMTRDEQAHAFAASVAGHPGVLAAVPQSEPAYHAADGAFLAYWRGHASFHFVN